MRVVAGSLRGRRLEAPPDRRARPTSDRVREAMFNALGSLGAVVGSSVVDLFAGTGALGIEALSRGAERATFVEHDARMLTILRRNLDALDLGDRAEVVAGPAERAAEEWIARGASFDVGLLDPPYTFAGWADLLGSLPVRLAVIESERPPELAKGWGVVRQKAYGGTLVTIVERSEGRSEDRLEDQARPGPDERRGEQ
jgi:16S rRNA (guanine966-N2)-methyltransferase